MPLQAHSISGAEYTQDVISVMNQVINMVQELATKLDETNLQVKCLAAKVEEYTAKVEENTAKVEQNIRQTEVPRAKVDGISTETRKVVSKETDHEKQDLVDQPEDWKSNIQEAVKRFRKKHKAEKFDEKLYWATVKEVLAEELSADCNGHRQLHHLEDENPLYDIAYKDYDELLMILLDGGLGVETHVSAKQEYKGFCQWCTLLHAAAQGCSKKVAKLLVDRGANINQVDGHSNTPLMIAVRDNNLAMVKWLIDHEADVNHIDDHYGYTALHYAAEACPAAVHYLVKAGADTCVRTSSGSTPFDLSRRHKEVQEYLSILPH